MVVMVIFGSFTKVKPNHIAWWSMYSSTYHVPFDVARDFLCRLDPLLLQAPFSRQLFELYLCRQCTTPHDWPSSAKALFLATFATTPIWPLPNCMQGNRYITSMRAVLLNWATSGNQEGHKAHVHMSFDTMYQWSKCILLRFRSITTLSPGTPAEEKKKVFSLYHTTPRPPR